MSPYSTSFFLRLNASFLAGAPGEEHLVKRPSWIYSLYEICITGTFWSRKIVFSTPSAGLLKFLRQKRRWQFTNPPEICLYRWFLRVEVRERFRFRNYSYMITWNNFSRNKPEYLSAIHSLYNSFYSNHFGICYTGFWSCIYRMFGRGTDRYFLCIGRTNCNIVIR